jgi:hypothetical protein
MDEEADKRAKASQKERREHQRQLETLAGQKREKIMGIVGVTVQRPDGSWGAKNPSLVGAPAGSIRKIKY